MPGHSINILVPKPCTENWDKMTPNESGRHCAGCNKTVVDFSLFTNKQLIEFFEKHTGRICGRYTSKQVGNEISYTEPSNSFLYRLVFGTLMVASAACSYNGNYNPNSLPLTMQYASMGSDNKNEENKPDYSTSPGDTIHYVYGRVHWGDGNKGVMNAQVTVEGISGKVLTDSSGSFRIYIPESFKGKLLNLTTIWGSSIEEQTFVADDFPVKMDVRIDELMIMGDTVAPPKRDTIINIKRARGKDKKS